MQTCWQIGLLGELRAGRDGRLVTHFGTRKTAALLAFLAFHTRRSHPRELLAELLWPEEDPSATRVRLRTALVTLRQILEPEGVPPGTVLLADRASVRLMPEVVRTDVREFEAALREASLPGLDAGERAEWLRRGLELYSGDLLPGFYEEWITPERERLADAFVTAVMELAGLEAELGVRLHILAVTPTCTACNISEANSTLHIPPSQPNSWWHRTGEALL
jgi:DNA-binding SARP family transcriptional activator